MHSPTIADLIQLRRDEEIALEVLDRMHAKTVTTPGAGSFSRLARDSVKKAVQAYAEYHRLTPDAPVADVEPIVDLEPPF